MSAGGIDAKHWLYALALALGLPAAGGVSGLVGTHQREDIDARALVDEMKPHLRLYVEELADERASVAVSRLSGPLADLQRDVAAMRTDFMATRPGDKVYRHEVVEHQDELEMWLTEWFEAAGVSVDRMPKVSPFAPRD